MTTNANTMSVNNYRYIVLESDICYDWDDYGVWGAVYYDVEENAIGTCKYGHGVDMNLENSISLEDAVKAGMDEEMMKKIITTMFKSLPCYFDMHDFASHFGENNKYCCIPVKVVGGRKFKGDAYIIGARKVYERYGLGAYRGAYSYYPICIDANTLEEVRVNAFGYCEIDEKLRNEYNESLPTLHTVNVDTIKNIAHAWAYNMSYSGCDRDNYRGLVNKLSHNKAFRFVNNHNEIINKYIEIKKKKEEKRLNQLRNEKMPAIIEWVKNNTDKNTEKEINALAEHIFKKHYA